MPPSRVLFIRPEAFGDVLLTSPFRRMLEAQGHAVDTYTLAGQACRNLGPGSRMLPMKAFGLNRILRQDYAQVYWFSYEHDRTLTCWTGTKCPRA